MEPNDDITSVPKYGLKVKLNHKYPENWDQNWAEGPKPPWNELLNTFLRGLRYALYYIQCIWQGRRPMMDFVNVERSKQMYGVPIGGIGAGTIGRGYKGEFCRYQLRPGIYDYTTVDANQFIVTIKDNTQTTIFQSVLSTYEKKSKVLSSWKWNLDAAKCNYTGLYPRAWTEYDLSDYGVKLICRQISPVIPHNYTDSSLPCAVFVWDVENVSSEELNVTIAFTFKNGIGLPKLDAASTSSSEPFSYLGNEGVVLNHTINKTNCAYALAAKARDDLNISKCVYFDPNSDGKEPWNQLYTNGKFDQISGKKFDKAFGEMAVGIAVQAKVPANNHKTAEFTLVWDMPVVTFFYKKRAYSKYYRKFFDTTLKIVDHALKQYSEWERAIYQWQIPVLSNTQYPDWYKGALFNQTYFVSDGGTVWFVIDEDESKLLPANDPRLTYGRFAYLEGHEYRMYNTYDVHFYASFALAMNWPKLQEVLQYDLRDSIFMELPQLITEHYNGNRVPRKVKDTVPHDVGDPYEDAFLLINAYQSNDISEWRDLNTKFCLQVFRDYNMRTDDNKKQYLQDMYKAVRTVMLKSVQFDTDGDGIIDNTGSPDQTYDTWVMTGASAYCGSLWLAAVYAMTIMADVLDEAEDKEKFQQILEKGKVSFDRKLWNGKYYNFDVSKTQSKVIMTDQLCGHWYLRASGVKYEVFPQEKVVSALKTVFDYNVLRVQNGTMGAINGMNPDGTITVITPQSQEVWTGVTYALAASMIHEGMLEEAWKTAGAMSTFMTERLGLSYEIPEAMYIKDSYRSIGYMRPLSIWAMQLALNNNNNK